MIRVDFEDGTSKEYRIGPKRLGANNWHHVEYKQSFGTIATIIKVSIANIKAWRVI